MKARDFAYWLQGFFEIANPTNGLTQEQTKIVQNHLNLVFKHDIDPTMPDPTGQLQQIHDGLIDTTQPIGPIHPNAGTPFVPDGNLLRC